MTGVLLVDDHPLFRSALITAVRRVQGDARVVEAQSLKDATARLRSDPLVSLVLLDLRMPDCQGFSGLLALRGEFPDRRIVVVSAAEDAETVRRALAFGAAGFIPKSAPLDVLMEALSTVLDGGVWTPPGFGPEADDEAVRRFGSLTPAQLRILMSMRKGLLNKQIAYDMGISEATVKSHVTMIFRKLGVTNRTQAVVAAEPLLLDLDAA
jgi:DNA-binding NarL/FixJ family response regulator